MRPVHGIEGPEKDQSKADSKVEDFLDAFRESAEGELLCRQSDWCWQSPREREDEHGTGACCPGEMETVRLFGPPSVCWAPWSNSFLLQDLPDPGRHLGECVLRRTMSFFLFFASAHPSAAQPLGPFFVPDEKSSFVRMQIFELGETRLGEASREGES